MATRLQATFTPGGARINHFPATLASKLTTIYENRWSRSTVRHYKRDVQGGVFIPRACCGTLSRAGAIDIINDLPLHLVEIKSRGRILRPEQEPIVDTLVAKVRDSESGVATLCLPAGSGKTYIVAGLIERLSARTLYIVHRRSLARQVRAVFASMLDCADGAINILVINTALKKPPSFFAQYSLVIFDEVHEYTNGNRADIFWRAQARYMLGMTATPDKGRNEIFKWHLGPLIRGAKQHISEFTLRVRKIVYSGCAINKRHAATGELFTHYMMEQFAADGDRMEVAMLELAELYDWRGAAGQSHGIFVFAEEIDILEKMAAIARKKNMDVAMLTGRVQESMDARVLFSTYSYGGTGVSIPRMTAIILLTPRKANIEQIIGRILRSGSDRSIERVVVDIVDSGTFLEHQYKVRARVYAKYTNKIEIV